MSNQANGNSDSPSRTYLFEPFSFKPLALLQHGEVFHYHTDHIGTPREITNARAEVVWSSTFKTYGALALAHVNEVENPLRFQGQYYDSETGLHYNRHRYYDPNCGQFTTQDPIGLLGGMNAYQYAPNPMTWVDPWGLKGEEVSEKSRSKGPVFAGHGSINPAKTVTVPDGTSVTIYSEPGATISDNLGQKIESHGDLSGLYSKTFNPGDQMPELVLHPNCGNLNISATSVQVCKTTSIKDLIKPNMGSCDWAACTHIPGHPSENVMYDLDGVFKIDPNQGVLTEKLLDGSWVKL